ncbi:MAG: TetR/AcrR family transcriptional regulator [Aeromicrobium sp.]|nr:TetR/AcrR family transcriptional regulator [Aeromicrobium sp.]
MPEPVKTRPYRATARAVQTARTRGTILAAALRLFTSRGYAGTTVRQIADEAGVHPDTLYASVGRKPEIMRALVEAALSGQAGPIEATERDYVRRIRSSERATEMIDVYAAAITAIQERMAPVTAALRGAAESDASCAALMHEISERRAANMLLFAADLRATGDLRDDLTDQEIADIVWSMNAAEYWELLVVRRGWTPLRFRDWLADAWRRTLLA